MRAMRDGKEVWIPLCKGDVISTERVRWREGEAMNARERACVRATDSRTSSVQLSLDSSLSQSYWQELITSLRTLSPPCPPTKEDGLIQHNEAFLWVHWRRGWLRSKTSGINFSSTARPFNCGIWWKWSRWLSLQSTGNHYRGMVNFSQMEPGSKTRSTSNHPKRKRWCSKFGGVVFTCSITGQLFTVWRFTHHTEKTQG